MVKIVFCGVGAVGSTAVTFCRNLSATFAFIDFDRVESKNLLAQAYAKPALGKNKAEALKAQLLSFWGIKSEAFGVRVGKENVEALCASADLIVDAFDNAASRRVLSDFARAKEIPLVHAAISGDGTFGLVRWDERFVPDAEDHAGQATCEGGEHLPMLGVLGASLARVIQDFVKDGTKRDLMISLASVTPT